MATLYPQRPMRERQTRTKAAVRLVADAGVLLHWANDERRDLLPHEAQRCRMLIAWAERIADKLEP